MNPKGLTLQGVAWLTFPKWFLNDFNGFFYSFLKARGQKGK
jgi:hypothetical protein